MKTRIASAAIWLLILGPFLLGADWPGFRGPTRDGHAADVGLLKEWPQGGPKLVWTFDKAGTGYSGPAVVGDTLYMMGARDGSEYLFAIDVNQGKETWSLKLAPTFSWKGNAWNDGPSATPTVDGELVYALSGAGELVCATTKGEQKWRKSMPKDLAGEVNPIGGDAKNLLGWGYTWSPLVDGKQLICVPGGKQGLLAALDKTTGEVIWRSKEVTDQATYSSPIVADVQGVRQYIAMTNEGCVGVEAKTGKLLWDYRRKPAFTDCVIPTPIYKDDHVYTTVGFGLGCDLVKLTKDGDKFKTEAVYSNRNMTNREGGVVLVDGKIYGHSETKGWVCQDFMTGKNAWSEKRKMKAGSILYADGLLYAYDSDSGDCALLKPDPKKWSEVSRFPIPQKGQNKPNGKIWTHPVIANGKLYLRDQEFLFCFDIKKK
jgi:outer membrane protein assembly factor BamB